MSKFLELFIRTLLFRKDKLALPASLSFWIMLLTSCAIHHVFKLRFAAQISAQLLEEFTSAFRITNLAYLESNSYKSC
jgi:hypothetical protein